ncbi:hypothetical protein F4679DRAFT_592628 [Xylaria curta]|nr:hypothetical protein F4679DRAFT_592628 [Xylaria curta]
MTVAPTLSLDVLLDVSSHLGARDLLNLGATQQALKQLFTHRAFIAALTRVPFDQDLKPVTYALQNGDIQLLSKTVGVLDALFPEGWQWSKFYAKGVGRLLTFAAAHNLLSLQYLVQQYPLIPGPRGPVVQANQVPAPAHDFYSVGGSHAPSMVSIRNWELVIEALKKDRYDCASFLLNYQPSLFPDGFMLRAHPTCYSSHTTLNFLLNHGANPGVNPLHYLAETDPRDPQVFDVLAQRGFGIDSPPETLRHLPNMWSTSTPLQRACQFLQPRSVEALLRLGANPNGVASRFFIHRVSFMGSYQYSSPHPILTLLLSTQWVSAGSSFGSRLIDCFQLLLHYGATTSIPLLNGDLLEILMLRIWRVLYTQATRGSNFVLTQVPDRPGDLNQGVQSFLFALNEMDVSPWDHVCQVFSDILHGDAGLPRGKERLIQLLGDYQNKFGDLPGPAQLQQSSLLILPDRYLVSEIDSA